jgi:hypothetical protein
MADPRPRAIFRTATCTLLRDKQDEIRLTKTFVQYTLLQLQQYRQAKFMFSTMLTQSAACR